MPAHPPDRSRLDQPIVLDHLDPPVPGFARGRELTGHDLDRLYAHPTAKPDGRPGWLRVNFVSSLDGSAVGDDGRSGSINTASDHEVFATLRSQADVVLVGAGTVRAEGYRAIDLQPWQRELRLALGLAPFPLLAVLSASLDLDPAIGAGATDRGPVLVLTSERADPKAADRLRGTGIEVGALPGGTVEVGYLVDHLVGRGCPRILCEGGAGLHRRLVGAGLVDELCLTVSSRLVGGAGGRIVGGEPLRPNRTARLAQLAHSDDGAVFSRYLLDPVDGSSSGS